ncbi:MAG: hypothetical protein HYS78_00355 [Parcubacteria group bacterium]|nr:hypothetical protein [Parcubacteria group bacterium]
MENIIFQIYGTFILALAGFVLPIITIAMSAFPEGVKLLRQTYENERKQAEKNLESEIEKQKFNKDANYDLLGKNITTLKSIKKKAEKRLLYLSPQYILSQSSITVGVSLVSFLFGVFFYNQAIYIPVTLFIISVVFFIQTLTIFSNSIEIIIETSIAVQSIRRTTEEKTIELLTILADNSKIGDQSLFIDPKDIRIFFNDEEVTTEKEYIFSVSNKHSVKISLKNLSDYMLKTAELGFTFPVEFLVEGTIISSIYTDDTKKIIRFTYDHLQSKLNLIVGNVDMTFLKTGVFDVESFIKGENLKRKTIKFKIKIVD